MDNEETCIKPIGFIAQSLERMTVHEYAAFIVYGTIPQWMKIEHELKFPQSTEATNQTIP